MYSRLFQEFSFLDPASIPRLKYPKLAMVRVLFLHPDLGAGGSERLVVDAALVVYNVMYQ